ncbi:MAG TPA: hypothetical protein VKD23_15170 [Terriglobales bacterium]|nr:hypothetical protein [Terriglobales bacterium]
MAVELVPAAAARLKGSEQAAMGFAEGRGLQVAGHHGGVDVAPGSKTGLCTVLASGG